MSSDNVPTVEVEDDTINQIPEVVLDDPSTPEVETPKPAEEEDKTPLDLGEDGLPILTDIDIENAADLGFGSLNETKQVVEMVRESLKTADPAGEEYKNGFELLANIQRGSRQAKDIRKNLFFMCNLEIVRVLKEIQKDAKVSPIVLLLEKGLERVTGGYGLHSFFDLNAYGSYVSKRLSRAQLTIKSLGDIQSNHSKYMTEVFRAMNLFPHAYLKNFLEIYKNADLGRFGPTPDPVTPEEIFERKVGCRAAIEKAMAEKDYTKTYVLPYINDLLNDDDTILEFITDLEIHGLIDLSQKILNSLEGEKESYDAACDVVVHDIATSKKFSKSRNTFLTDGFSKDYRNPESVVALQLTNLLPSEFFINLDLHDDLESKDKATFFRILTSVFIPRFFDTLLDREPNKEIVTKSLTDPFIAEAVFKYVSEEAALGKKTRAYLVKALLKFRYEVLKVLLNDLINLKVAGK